MLFGAFSGVDSRSHILPDLDGSPTKITTDGNTTIQDDSNPPKTLDFGDLYKGTDVEVKYDSNNVATKIVKTS